MHDYLIVGAGLFGSTFAHQAKLKGKSCLIIDKRSHSGGNVYCQDVEGIVVHTYGPHIFHTNHEPIWKYVNSLTSFNHFTYSPLANYEGQLYNLPFNMHTFYQLWGVTTPEQAMKKIQETHYCHIPDDNPMANVRNAALCQVGAEIYEKFIKGYTEKQWGRSCQSLPASIIKRIPVRYTFNNNYFNDRFQGIPAGGYNKLINTMQSGIEVCLNTDYLHNRQYFDSLAKKVIYSGPIDEFFNFRFGDLEYRSLRFEHRVLETPNFQGVAVINHTSAAVPFTRTIEHKHFEWQPMSQMTVLTHEFPITWRRGLDPFYPINDSTNNKRLAEYRAYASEHEPNVIFGGRLGSYQYYNMDQVIAQALKLATDLL